MLHVFAALCPMALLPLQELPAPAQKEAQRPVGRVFLTHGFGEGRGSALRGKSRVTESGDWQVRQGGSWVDLPAAAVDRVFVEKELLKEFDERRKASRKTALPADSAADLEWALGSGLLQEAFKLGDALLEEHPFHGRLREIAGGRAARFIAGMPDRGAEGELKALMDLGGLGSAFVSEAVLERLMTAAPRAELLGALRANLRSKSAGERSFALRALGRLFGSEDPRALLLHAIYDPSEMARVSAARAVADVGALEIAGPLVKALNSESSTVRSRAAAALGETREEAFVEPLMDRLYTLSAPAPPGGGGSGRAPRGYIFVGTQRAYIQDFDVEVAAGSSVADPVVNTLMEGSVLGASAMSTTVVTVTVERRVILRSLGLTAGVKGAGAGLRGSGNRRSTLTSKDWTKWWESEASAPLRRDRGQVTQPK